MDISTSLRMGAPWCFRWPQPSLLHSPLQKDLEYWCIDELVMEPCCALKYFPKIEVCLPQTAPFSLPPFAPGKSLIQYSANFCPTHPLFEKHYNCGQFPQSGTIF